jgi:copper(I)-binding protein
MTINNDTDQAVTLDTVTSPDFAMIQIHLTTMRNGMAHMQKQAELQIGPKSSIRFEPGSLHLMLMHPVRPVRAGDTINLQLHLGNGKTIEVVAPVRK